jgi:GTP cyclohydrolase I
MKNGTMEEIIKDLLLGIGEDPEREGLKKTPQRATRAWAHLTKGYQEDPHELIKSAIFQEENREMVLLKDIDFFSLCEHHLLPFFGKAQVAYIPDRQIIGLSKLARLVDVFARRLQVQERLTRQIAQALQDALKPQGVAVIMEAEHLCMQMRGVEKQNSVAVTSCMEGVFRDNPATRAELLNLIQHGGKRAF